MTLKTDNLLSDLTTKKLVSDTLHKCDDGELYLENTINENFLFDDNVLKNSSFNKVEGFELRAINNELVGYSHSNSLNLETIKKAAATVSTIKKGYSGTLAV